MQAEWTASTLCYIARTVLVLSAAARSTEASAVSYKVPTLHDLQQDAHGPIELKLKLRKYSVGFQAFIGWLVICSGSKKFLSPTTGFCRRYTSL